jgi:hypothetical protein
MWNGKIISTTNTNINAVPIGMAEHVFGPVDAIKFRRTSVNTELSIWHHIAEDMNIHQYHLECLKSHTVNIRNYSFQLHMNVMPNSTVKCWNRATVRPIFNKINVIIQSSRVTQERTPSDKGVPNVKKKKSSCCPNSTSKPLYTWWQAFKD